MCLAFRRLGVSPVLGLRLGCVIRGEKFRMNIWGFGGTDNSRDLGPVPTTLRAETPVGCRGVSALGGAQSW